MTSNGVQLDEGGSRFVLEQDGQTAELTFDRSGDRLVLLHTGVPEAMSGGGVGGTLVQAAVSYAGEHELVVVPECTFARGWIERHPDETAGVTVDGVQRG